MRVDITDASHVAPEDPVADMAYEDWLDLRDRIDHTDIDPADLLVDDRPAGPMGRDTWAEHRGWA